jgi:hypothetical protein
MKKKTTEKVSEKAKAKKVKVQPFLPDPGENKILPIRVLENRGDIADDADDQIESTIREQIYQATKKVGGNP